MVKVYIDKNDLWVGYYRGDRNHYICPLPTVVIRWSRSWRHERMMKRAIQDLAAATQTPRHLIDTAGWPTAQTGPELDVWANAPSVTAPYPLDRPPHTLLDLQRIARDAYLGIRDAYAAAGKNLETEAGHMHLAAKCAEEGAEVLKAYLRASGWARKGGSWDDLDEELADTVISAFLVAYAENRNLPEAIWQKVQVVFSRGWKTP